MKRGMVGLAVLGLLLLAPAVQAGTISIVPGGRPVSAAEAGGGAPAGGFMHTFFVNTDSDIISIDNIKITINGSLYQNPFGTDNEAPNALLIPVFPALAVDSWITTPAATSVAGGGFAAENSSWFDTDNNGAQNNFQFAALTLPAGVRGTFSGRVNTLGQGGASVDNFSFSFVIPEPTSLGLAGFGMLAALVARRRNA